MSNSKVSNQDYIVQATKNRSKWRSVSV